MLIVSLKISQCRVSLSRCISVSCGENTCIAIFSYLTPQDFAVRSCFKLKQLSTAIYFLLYNTYNYKYLKEMIQYNGLDLEVSVSQILIFNLRPYSLRIHSTSKDYHLRKFVVRLITKVIVPESVYAAH